MCKLMKMQPSLIHVPIKKDIVYTPDWLAKDMVDYFYPEGNILEPCKGDGVFLKYLPDNTDWCEISDGKDFYAYSEKVDFIIGNPPYSNLLSWIRHSFTIAKNIIYLVPLHRVFASAEFLNDLYKYGGVINIRLYGTGTSAGFPFGHALGAVHFKKRWHGDTNWSFYKDGK